MAKKPLGTDSMGIQKTMRVGDYLGDCGGQFALNAMTGLVSAVLYFYTEKVGVAAATAPNVLLAAKIVGAFTVLIMGKIMANGKSPKGKCRPWFLRMAIPALVAIVALFTVPAGLTGFAQVAYLFLSNVFLTAIVSTAIMIPYSAILVMRTKSLDERNKMGIFRAAAGYIIGMIIAIALVPITNALGPNGVADQMAYIKFAVIVGTLSTIFLLILYKTSKETAAQEEKPDDGLAFGDALGKLFHNKYWVIVLVVNLLSCIIYGLTAGAGVYYCKWIFGNDNLVGVLGGIGMIPTLLGFIFVGPMIKKLGVVKTLLVSFAMGAGANILLLFTKDIFFCYALFGSITTFATIPMMCLVGVMTAMSIDYNEYKYGVRMVATSNSASSFGGKVGSGLGTSIIGWFLAAVGYDAALTAAPAATKMAIYGFTFVTHFVIFVNLFIVVCSFDVE